MSDDELYSRNRTQENARRWKQNHREVRCRLCGEDVGKHSLKVLIDHMKRGGVRT